jgi:hypothetical protein
MRNIRDLKDRQLLDLIQQRELEAANPKTSKPNLILAENQLKILNNEWNRRVEVTMKTLY